MPAESQQQMHHLAKEFFTLPAASKDRIIFLGGEQASANLLPGSRSFVNKVLHSAWLPEAWSM